MRLTIEPTGEFFTAGGVMCRMWRGHDEVGVPVFALVSLVKFGGDTLQLPEGLISIPPPSPREMQSWAEAIQEGAELDGRGPGPGAAPRPR